MLKNKNIIVAISGGIAAYKSAELVRLLRRAEANVQVVMTASAKQFISPLTLQALSGNAVRDELFSLQAENAMGHIELARWAELIVIAPASANMLAQLAYGFADDLLATLCLATRAPIALVPAMNQRMWHHPHTQQNVSRLCEQGMLLWGPDSGEQACGDLGFGRMIEPLEILQHIEQHWQPGRWSGKKIMISAGATREALDPVRCLSNISSGKMGYALAEQALRQGAQVLLISGASHLPVPQGVQCIKVASALDMHKAVMQHLSGIDIFIAAAAVSDYRPVHYSEQKIKKSNLDSLQLLLERNPDIVKDVAASAMRPACVVGFAAETENMLENALSKLQHKNLDFIVANQVGEGQGIESDENAAVLLNRQGVVAEFALMPKRQLAAQLITALPC